MSNFLHQGIYVLDNFVDIFVSILLNLNLFIAKTESATVRHFIT